jgi:hypothetical protein
MVSGPGATVTLKVWLSLAPLASVAVITTVYAPSTVGVPVRTPVLEMLTPGGVPVAVHVYGLWPPDAAT